MPQYRKLHVKITESYDVNDMPDDTHRLLWTWLMLGADREGRFLDNPAAVKSKVFPLRTDITYDQMATMLDWFATRGLIRRYTVDGRGYFYLTNFKKLQRDTEKEAPSLYPEPPAPNSGAGQELVQSESRPTQEQVESRSSTDTDAYTDTDTKKNAAEKKSAAVPLPEKRPDQAMWDALVEACHIKYISKKMRGTLNSTIPVLVSMGLSPPDIGRYAKWYEDGWHRDNAPLHLGILEKGIGAWIDLGKPASRATKNGAKSDRHYDHEVMDEDKFRAALSEVQGRGVPVQPVRAGDGLEDGTGSV